MKNKEHRVLATVQQNGRALQGASEEMKNKEHIVLAAVQQNGIALQFASEEMKNKENIVLAAVLKDSDALEHACEEMKTSMTQTIDVFYNDHLAGSYSYMETAPLGQLMHHFCTEKL